MSRPDGRRSDELRPVRLERSVSRNAEGSALIECGATRVLCTASVDERVPPFLRGSGRGWVTAQYGMLPRATAVRTEREASRGRQGGRTHEIQRLIGRVLRTTVDLAALQERTITLDCDVLEADGGTRTAAITGAWVALWEAGQWLAEQERVRENPITGQVAAVSVGLYEGEPVLDLAYAEDQVAEADCNIAMNVDGDYVEVQGTAEGRPFSPAELDRILSLARAGITTLLDLQKRAIARAP